MRVLIPPPLRSYSGGRVWVEVEGATLGAVLDALDARYPGLRFRIVDEQDRIRPHIRFIVREEFASALTCPLAPGDEVTIICALSGGSTLGKRRLTQGRGDAKVGIPPRLARAARGRSRKPALAGS